MKLSKNKVELEYNNKEFYFSHFSWNFYNEKSSINQKPQKVRLVIKEICTRFFGTSYTLCIYNIEGTRPRKIFKEFDFNGSNWDFSRNPLEFNFYELKSDSINNYNNQIKECGSFFNRMHENRMSILTNNIIK